MHQIIYETCGFVCEIELDYQSITRPLILKREASGFVENGYEKFLVHLLMVSMESQLLRVCC